MSLLHALWDSMHNLAVVLTYLLTGTPWQLHLFQRGYLPQPTLEQVRLFTLLSIGGLGVVSVLGIITLWGCWHSARTETASADPDVPQRFSP